MKFHSAWFLAAAAAATTEDETNRHQSSNNKEQRFVPSNVIELSDHSDNPLGELEGRSLAIDEPSWLRAGEGVVSSGKCADQMDCFNCTSLSSWCHWCSDGACHAKGSRFGCFSGVTCKEDGGDDDDDDDDDNNNNDDDNNDDNDDDDNTNKGHCKSHTNCAECSLSNMCHWCAKDNKCHAVGSPYGCLSGVDCYSNDRCQRTESEPLTTNIPGINKMKKLPLIVILSSTFFMAFLCTLCLCCARGVKASYDELAELALVDEQESRIIEMHMQDENDEPIVTASTPLLNPEAVVEQQENPEVVTKAEGPPEPEATGGDDAAAAAAVVEEDQDDVLGNNGYVEVIDIEEQPQPPDTPSPHRRRPKQMQRMYNACVACYCISIAVLAGFCFGSIRYFPKMPEYNICNDDIAWRSLMEHMAKMKAVADIEILASVANYNAIDVAMDKGGGTFYHESTKDQQLKEVGTFDIPPTIIKAFSITDILIVAHFSPKNWEAYQIGTDYLHGDLVLHVDAHGTIRVPFLMDYTFEGKFENLVVYVNKLSGRKYCHCPSWKDAKNKTMTTTTTSNEFLALMEK